jgi:hypothetical protein
VLTPVVTANQSLSTALQAVDGSGPTLHNANSAVTQAQTTLTEARGAITALSVPPSQGTLSQDIQQALIQENGYLQAVQGTLSDPIGQPSAQLRPLATNTQSAFVAIASVAPGGAASVSGIDNFLSWVSGANAQAKAKTPPKVIVQSNTTTVQSPAPTVPAPSSDPTAGMVSQGPGIWSSPTISYDLANNVFYWYWNAWYYGGDTSSFSAWSDVTDQWYTVDATTDGTYVYCSVLGTTNPNAEVVLSASGVAQYTLADAQAYVNSGKAE